MSDADVIAALKAANEKLRSVVHSLAVRVAAQSEQLTKAAGARVPASERERELLAALEPLAAVLGGGWDTGELAPGALYPVTMGDLRRAARTVALVRGRQ